MRIVEAPAPLLWKAVDDTLTYLSLKYGVSKPYFTFEKPVDPYIDAVYDTRTKSIVFFRVSPLIVAHEAAHHIDNELNLKTYCDECFADAFAERHLAEIAPFWAGVFPLVAPLIKSRSAITALATGISLLLAAI